MPSSSTCAAACLRPTSSCSPSCWPSRSCRTASRLTQVRVQHLWILCKLCCSGYARGPSAKLAIMLTVQARHLGCLVKLPFAHLFINSFVTLFLPSFVSLYLHCVHPSTDSFKICLPLGSLGTAKVESPQVDNMLSQAGCVVVTPVLWYSPPRVSYSAYIAKHICHESVSVDEKCLDIKCQLRLLRAFHNNFAHVKK